MEAVVHGVIGWRVHPDDPNALAAALEVDLAMTMEARLAMGVRQAGRDLGCL